MNVFGKKERSWRKARKRGVSPIIATILLVAITVVLAAVLYVLISGLTTGGANTVPIGTTFAFGTAQQAANSNCASGDQGAGSCYAIGIQSAGSSATTSNIHFAVLKSGAGQTFVKVVVIDTSSVVVATYTTSWAAGASPYTTLPQSFASTQTIILDFGTGTASGMTFEAIGVGSLSGTTTIALP